MFLASSLVLLGVGLALLWLIWYWVPGLSALLVFMGSVCASFCWSGVPAFIFEDFCSDFWLLFWLAAGLVGSLPWLLLKCLWQLI